MKASNHHHPARVLVITNSAADAEVIRDSLEGAPGGSFEVDWVGRSPTPSTGWRDCKLQP